MITLHRSNRTEQLVDALAAVVGEPLGDPFAPEHIVVQGKGMERWLSMELARRLGVWANPKFPFPRKIVETALEAVLGPAPAGVRNFEPESLLWSVARLLGELRSRAGFESIDAYLDGDRNGIKLIQLAKRIADTFDHYTIYRPEMVLEWETTTGGDWQAVLWRELVRRQPAEHLAARVAAFRAAAAKLESLTSAFPTRLCFFGMSTLPPLYLDLLAILERWVDVHVFVLSPSREFWADIRSERERTREAVRNAGATALPASIGNPLLASLGRLGRDFQNLLLEHLPFARDDERWCEPASNTMLGQVQRDIFRLVHRTDRSDRPDSSEERPLPLHRGDESIRVHSCHGPMREIEVLRDQLLDLFARNATLQPHDVIVMTPSIDAYAPYIEAVFSSRKALTTDGIEPHDERAIPFRIADRGVRATNEPFEALGSVIDALRDRFTAAAVLDLLGIDLVRIRFGIEPADLDPIRTWVVESGIRWGVDGTDRRAIGLPDFHENSWRFGFERLFLGYAMEGRERVMFERTLPYDDIEGKAAAPLGRLAELCEVLFAFRERVAAPHPPAEWNAVLSELLAATVASTPDNLRQHQEIRTALAALAERAGHAGFDGEVDLTSLRDQLEAELARLSSARGFLSGGVTFCELVPMRTIPFRVVCLVGLDDGTFPRTRRPLGFDLIAHAPRPGDRSQREDDRYLFLEALLSAREYLLITYTGRSVHDNSELPPSVVVSELLDALDESFFPSVSSVPSARHAVVVQHPLQPFSPRYFTAHDDGRLFSYSAGFAAGACALLGPRAEQPRFVSGLLPPAEPRTDLDLDSLIRFFDHPTRHFCRQRMELYLEEAGRLPDEREPLEPNDLEKWMIGDALLKAAEDGLTTAEMLDPLRARGVLPPRSLGQVTFGDIEPLAARIGAAAARRRDGRLEPVPFEITAGGVRLTGTLRNLSRGGLVEMQYSKLERNQELRLWIRHLVLQRIAPRGTGVESVLVGRGKDGPAAIRLKPVSDAQARLAELIDLYQRGLESPLPLFRTSSRAYAATFHRPLLKKKADVAERAAEAARKAFAGDGYRNHGDWNDPYVRLVYNSFRTPQRAFDGLMEQSSDDPLSFAALARRLWDPMLEHREEIEA